MSTMSSPIPADLESRRHQLFPELTEAEIARIGRFGSVRRYGRGERLLTAGEPSPGMLVVLEGAVAISPRDGLGHGVPGARHTRAPFLAERGQLSGLPARGAPPAAVYV